MKFIIKDKYYFIFFICYLSLFHLNVSILTNNNKELGSSTTVSKHKISTDLTLNKSKSSESKLNLKHSLKDSNIIENDNSCFKTCENCKEKVCTKCLKGFFLYENKCLKLCPVNLIADISSRKCIPLNENSK